MNIAFRILAAACLVAALIDFRLTEEVGEARPDVALIVVDRSASQNVGNRTEQTSETLRALQEALQRLDDLEVRIVSAGREGDAGTALFAALETELAQAPGGRFAGAVMITDGQVHDTPSQPLSGPLHVLLTGERGERDRRIVVEQAPAYGIVGSRIEISYRVEDLGMREGREAEVRILRDGDLLKSTQVRSGETFRISLPVERAGPVVVELEADPVEGELGLVNNRTVVSFNGVRDRLRVLLISGQPHPGERTWRNLLKSDPLVDLVHFTILRSPKKRDFTPINELALIAFPVKSLFEENLDGFDLVVFDRYVLRQVMTSTYQRNLVDYVRNGGALLAASGPELAGPRGLERTRLREILPTRTTGRVLEEGFKPALSAIGERHPVTNRLGSETWGRWFRAVEAETITGDALLQGPEGLPLLVVGRVGEGRIAQFLSDHIWLWARGFEGGGPYAELMRRVVHWLMKEPDLEEEALAARMDADRIAVERRTLSRDAPAVTVTGPSGDETRIEMTAGQPGLFEGSAEASDPGLYRASDGTHTVFAIKGSPSTREQSDLRASADRLAPEAKASGGGVFWLTDGRPGVRRVDVGRDRHGRGWMGFVRNKARVVTGSKRVPLFPAPLLPVLAMLLLVAAWWREGR